jgi:hypothetical protein
MSFHPRHLTAVALAALLAGCADHLAPGDVAGTYRLVTVNGAAVPLPGVNVLVSGSMTLTSQGEAERRVQYRIDTQGQVREFDARGTFQLQGSVLRLALHEEANVWTPSALLIGTTLRLRYPDPGDGPDIVEFYEQE